MDTLKIGLIGAGDVARSAHMPSYAANGKVEVVAVADPDVQSAQALADRYGIGKVTANYHEILDDSSIAAVDLCVPHYHHYGITMDALNEGKHVICDKPIAMNLEEADRMIHAAHELGLWLLIVLNQRYLPMHRKIKGLLSDGSLGKPFLMNAFVTGNVMPRMNDASSWIGSWDRAGGGAFFDSGTHIVDLMRYWYGEPTAVTAVLKRLLVSQENKADDNAIVTFEYDDDMVASIMISYSVENEPWSERKFIYGSAGSVSTINESTVPMFLVQDNSPQMVEVEHRADWWPWSIDIALRNFVDCILENAQPLVTEEEARADLKLIECAYRSAREGKRVEIA